MSFTFTATPDVTTADVGDTIHLAYCGENTSDIDLEIVKLVDDRLGLVLQLPDVVTLIAPGQTLCNTDVGIEAAYSVQPTDAGTVIHTNAVVTVQTLEDQPRCSRRRRRPTSPCRRR